MPCRQRGDPRLRAHAHRAVPPAVGRHRHRPCIIVRDRDQDSHLVLSCPSVLGLVQRPRVLCDPLVTAGRAVDRSRAPTMTDN